MRGKFLTLEGGEGVGKSTNLRYIEEYLNNAGINFLVTREPGGTPLAEELRNLLLARRTETVSEACELLMVFAARAQHLQQLILPALEQGRWVLCDRFTDATYAYQGGGRGLSLTVIETLEALVQGSLRPDCTLLLDAPVEVGMERVGKRGGLDRFESERADFFRRVRDSYRQRAAAEPERFRVVDASLSLPEVQTQIQQVMDKLLRG